MTRPCVNDPAAASVGPYSHGVWAGDLLFLSGQTPIDPATRVLVAGDIGAQTRQCLANLAAVLAQAGLGLADAVKCNVYLVDMGDFGAMNQAYREFFTEPFPARTTIGVAALPLGARVEIELVARRAPAA